MSEQTPYDWMDEARQIAAQRWCDDETKRIEMNTALAEAVARRIAAWMQTGALHAQNESYWRNRTLASESRERALREALQELVNADEDYNSSLDGMTALIRYRWAQKQARSALAQERPDVVSAPMDHPVNSIDHRQQRGMHADIIDEAFVTYEQWMLDDDYDAMTVLHKIMDRMRERRERLSPAHPAGEGRGS